MDGSAYAGRPLTKPKGLHLENPAFIVAMVSTIGFVLYTLVAGALGDHHGGGGSDHGSHGGADGWGLLQLISVQAVLLAMMSYSWSWLYWVTVNNDILIQIGLTLLSGTAMVGLYVGGMRLIGKLNTPESLPDFEPTVGMQGVVYLTVPPAGDGFGQVTFLHPQLGDFQVNATSHEEEIATGSLVFVTETDQLSVKVRKA